LKKLVELSLLRNLNWALFEKSLSLAASSKKRVFFKLCQGQK
jgi:hypothetical protein